MAAHSKVVMIIIVMTTKIMVTARMVNTTGMMSRSYQFSICGSVLLAQVMKAIDTSLQLGFEPVKVTFWQSI